MIGKAIFAMLSTDAGVKALVDDRIYPSVSPDNLYPFVVYSVEQEPEVSVDEQEWKEFSVTLTIVSRSYASTQKIAKAVKHAMDGQRGTWGGIFIGICCLNAPTSEDTYSDGGNSEIIYHTQEQTYRVWINLTKGEGNHG